MTKKLADDLDRIGWVSKEGLINTLNRHRQELDLALSSYRAQRTAAMATMSQEDALQAILDLGKVSSTVIILIQKHREVCQALGLPDEPEIDLSLEPQNSQEPPSLEEDEDPVIQEAVAATKEAAPPEEEIAVVPEQEEETEKTQQAAQSDLFPKEEEQDEDQGSEEKTLPETRVSSKPAGNGQQTELPSNYPVAPFDPDPCPAPPAIPDMRDPGMSPRTGVTPETILRLSRPRKIEYYYIDPFLRDGDFIFHIFLRDDMLTSYQVIAALDHEWFHGRMSSGFRKKDLGATFRALREKGLLDTGDGTKTLYVTAKGKELLKQFHPNQYDPYKEERKYTLPEEQSSTSTTLEV